MFDGIVFLVVGYLIIAPWIVILYPYIDDSLGPISKNEKEQ